ncbi:MAG: hypothetical protein J6J35_00320 [Alphaproteobacteria bacterium]|nr:hypothetical protein [Alphaproteobacteria bacterium]
MNKLNNTALRILFSSDNELFVVKKPLTPDEKAKYERYTAKEIETELSSQINRNQSRAVRLATPPRSITPDFSGYENELSSAPQMPEPPKGYKNIFFPCLMDDALIPEDMRKLGIKVHRRIQKFFLDYSPEDDGLIFYDEHGLETDDYVDNGQAETDNLVITVNTPCFFITIEDYARLEAVKNRLSQAKTKKRQTQILNSLNDQDFAFYSFYEHQALLDKMISTILIHEFKHVKNNLLQQNRPYKKDYAAPNTTDLYLLEAEDERTAYLESLFFTINEYLKRENYADTSPFWADFSWLAQKLEKKSEKQIKSMLYPPEKIMNNGLKEWANKFYNTYTEQFKQNLLTAVLDNPLTPKDANHKEYKLEQRLLYTFKIYNPYTKKEEITGLADKITVPVPITAKIKRELIIPAQKERQEYYDTFKEAFQKHPLTKELIITAIALADKRYKKSINHQIAQKLEKNTSVAQTNLSPSLIQKLRRRFTRS